MSENTLLLYYTNLCQRRSDTRASIRLIAFAITLSVGVTRTSSELVH